MHVDEARHGEPVATVDNDGVIHSLARVGQSFDPVPLDEDVDALTHDSADAVEQT